MYVWQCSLSEIRDFNCATPAVTWRLGVHVYGLFRRTVQTYSLFDKQSEHVLRTCFNLGTPTPIFYRRQICSKFTFLFCIRHDAIKPYGMFLELYRASTIEYAAASLCLKKYFSFFYVDRLFSQYFILFRMRCASFASCLLYIGVAFKLN